ncbi:YHS domain-containing (seleno)protein [soil metagenome]
MKKQLSLSLILIFFIAAAMAQTKPVIFTTDAGAIQGYDPVAFFKESKPVMGTPDLTYTWNSAVWHFSTQENLDLFKATPEKYAPQFGGYCAFGVASGHKSPTEPETWTVVNDKLYFNYNKNVQKLWNKNQKGLIDQANKTWPTVIKE